MRATTDSDGELRFDPVNKPGVSNLLNIYSALTGKTVDEILAGQSWRGYGDLKKELVGVTQEALAPIKANYNETPTDNLLRCVKSLDFFSLICLIMVAGSIISEELGFLGVLIISLLFVFIFYSKIILCFKKTLFC